MVEGEFVVVSSEENTHTSRDAALESSLNNRMLSTASSVKSAVSEEVIEAGDTLDHVYVCTR